MKIFLKVGFLAVLIHGISACGANPPTVPADPGVQNLQVYAELDRQNGQWVVANYCTTSPASSRSRMQRCDTTKMNEQEALYFDVATLKPFKAENFIGCIDYSLVDKFSKRVQRCKDFESIYEASLNPAGMLGSAIHFVTTFGTTMVRRWDLDEDKFRGRSSLPRRPRRARPTWSGSEMRALAWSRPSRTTRRELRPGSSRRSRRANRRSALRPNTG